MSIYAKHHAKGWSAIWQTVAWKKLHIELRHGVVILCQTVFKDLCGDLPFNQTYVCTYLPRPVSCRNQ